MKLGDRFQQPDSHGTPNTTVNPDLLPGVQERRNNLKGRIHRRMIERLNLSSLDGRNRFLSARGKERISKTRS
jgi:hypothetical protein